MLRIVTIAASLALLLSACSASNTTTEPRKEISYLRGPYNAAFFRRHGESEAYSAGFHFHHGKEHDVTLLTPPADRARMDDEFDRQVYSFVKNKSRAVVSTLVMSLFQLYY